MPFNTLARRAALSLLAWLMPLAATASAREDYTRLCAGCHGASFRLPGGGESQRPAAELFGVIRDGVPARGMPAFATQLSAARLQALAELVAASRATGPKLGDHVEAETLHPVHSASYVTRQGRVGFFSERSSLCYENVDLTGVRSLELRYAKGNTDVGRFAILIGDGAVTRRVNLGEARAIPTGSWDRLTRQRVGLQREIRGSQLLCLYGVEGGGIFDLDGFTLSAEPGESDALTLTFAPPERPAVEAAGHRFALELVAEAPSELWSLAFLPEGDLLATQKSGQLLRVRRNGQVERITGLPAVWSGGQGGLMAVKPHPQYASNGWIYLTFSDPGPDNATAMTRVVRGRIEGLNWVAQQDIYRAPERFYTPDYAHFGSRLAFHDGHVYFSIGERQHPEQAQDLAFPFGKVHRLHDDGRVPRDNPFVGRADALPSIWSYGHRNPQGLTTHPRSGEIWSVEHGPMGGDELNLVRKGANYGWPRVSFGKHYDGTAVGPSPYLEGVEPPVHHWTPSIAVSQVEFYEGDHFPGWRGQLLVASLGFQELRLVRLRDHRVLNDQLLFKGYGRVRDVAVSPDGQPHVLLNDFTAGIYRLERRDARH